MSMWNEATQKVMEEEARKARKEDRDRAELFSVMVNTPAWKAYVALLNVKIQECGDIVMIPLETLDKALGMENVKGTMKGLLLARDLPSVVIATSKEQGNGQDVD